MVVITGMALSGCISSSSRDNTGVYNVARVADMDRLAGELAGNRAVLVGEGVAVAALVMCMLFVTVDLGGVHQGGSR